jgi:hypothetical protein
MKLGLTTAAIAAFMLIATAPAAGQWLGYPTPGIPRTPDGKPNLSAPALRAHDGKPDLTGLWQFTRGSKYALNAAADLETREIQPWARALSWKRMENLDDHEQCLPVGLSIASVHFFKIIQTPGLVVILYEKGPSNAFRQVFMDGRGLPKDPNPSWEGYSIGRWEGDTLVVDTGGFNDRTPLDDFWHPHTEALHLTERFRRRDFGHMEIQMTFDDPGAYTRSWTITAGVELATDTELLEAICENERDLVHKVRHTHVAVPAAVLRNYAGTYQMSAGREIHITLDEDDHLMVEQTDDPLRANAKGKLPLFAHSATSFMLELARLSTDSLEFEFASDSSGVVTHLIRSQPGSAGDKAIRKE